MTVNAVPTNGRRKADAKWSMLMDATQALLALGFGGSTLYLFVTTGNAPEGLIGLAGPIVTFYFRERANGIRNGAQAVTQ